MTAFYCSDLPADKLWVGACLEIDDGHRLGKQTLIERMNKHRNLQYGTVQWGIIDGNNSISSTFIYTGEFYVGDN